MTRTLRRPHRRDVPRDWETQLAELFPRSEQTSWLRLRWEPGYPWEPVERFVIDEMLPPQAVIPDVLEQLERPAPPKGHWDPVLDEYVREDDAIITTTAWTLFRETGCWARPFWVIQGTKGGHKRWFTPNEQKLLRLYGLPSDPAAPGDLPYAPFDQRVVDQLVKFDLLRDNQGRIRSALGRKKILTLVGFRRQEEEDARTFQKLLAAWLADQVHDIAPDVTKSLMALDAPRRDVDPARLEAAHEAAEARFIETGRAGGLLS